jgi:5-methylcytosine-specific restriction enzyme A
MNQPTTQVAGDRHCRGCALDRARSGHGQYIRLVTLTDVTREGVLAALAEFERLGRHEFLRSTGFHRSREYYLLHNGQLYDSKPILGYAHGASTGTSLGPRDFSGGDKTAAYRLEVLGFEMQHLPYVDWTRDELTLACEIVEANGWRQLPVTDPGVIALSQLLQSPANHPYEPRHPDFRNTNGVARKTADIATVHPEYHGGRTRGNKLDKLVLNNFLADPEKMRREAARIRELLSAQDASDQVLPDLDMDMDDAPHGEGGIALRTHLRRERDKRLRLKKIADTKRRGLPVACEACTFDFGVKYGPHGLDYIECHHRVPLHVSGETQTRLADLALLCSNCHRMIHHFKQWLTVEELQSMVAANTPPQDSLARSASNPSRW